MPSARGMTAVSKANELGPPLELSDRVVQPLEAAKFLGIWIDRKLSFKQQAEFALKKGTNWLLQFGRLARPKHSLSAKNIKSLYKQVLLPGMLYAASIWIKPQQKVDGRKQMYGSVGIIRQMGRVHRQACRLISGALRSTLTDLMEAHLNLPPFHLLVDKAVMREATRMCTLLESHPLHKHIKCAAKWVRHHRSPLHEVLVAYRLHPDKIETIEAVRLPPSWSPDFRVSIVSNKDAAEEEETMWIERDGWCVYTDRSEIDGRVGAAAVLATPNSEPKVLRFHLGGVDKHTVYEGELVGLALGVTLLKKERSVLRTSCVADNCANLQATMNTNAHRSHYLVDRLLRKIDGLQQRHPGINFMLQWILGHKGLEGNKLADKEVKKVGQQPNQGAPKLAEQDTPDKHVKDMAGVEGGV